MTKEEHQYKEVLYGIRQTTYWLTTTLSDIYEIDIVNTIGGTQYRLPLTNKSRIVSNDQARLISSLADKTSLKQMIKLHKTQNVPQE